MSLKGCLQRNAILNIFIVNVNEYAYQLIVITQVMEKEGGNPTLKEVM